MLSAAGFEEIQVSSHLLKSWVSGGMLLEVVARRRRGPLPREGCLEDALQAGIMKNRLCVGGREA